MHRLTNWLILGDTPNNRMLLTLKAFGGKGIKSVTILPPTQSHPIISLDGSELQLLMRIFCRRYEADRL